MWINRSGARRGDPPRHRHRPSGGPGTVRVEILEERLLLDGTQGPGPWVLFQPSPTPALVAPGDSSSGSATIGWISVTTGATTGPSTSPPGAVVAEADAPHATLATAQALPATPDSALLGALTPGAGPAIFGVPLDPSRLSLQITFSWSGPPPAGTDDGHLVILDAAGRTVFDQALSGQPVALTVMFQGLVTGPGGSFYVKLVPPPGAGDAPDGAAPAASGYVLRVTKGFGAALPMPAGMSPVVLASGTVPSNSPSAETPPGFGTSSVTTYYLFVGGVSWATNVVAGLPVTVFAGMGLSGSTAADQGRPPFTGLTVRLPYALSAPLGGIFAPHDPTPLDSNDDGVGVDLVLANLDLADADGPQLAARAAGSPAPTDGGPVGLARPSLVPSSAPVVVAVAPAWMPGPPPVANGPGPAAGPAGPPASSALGQAALAAAPHASRRLTDEDRAELPDLGVAWSSSAPAVARRVDVRGPEDGVPAPGPGAPGGPSAAASGPVAAGSDALAMLAAIVEEEPAAGSRRPARVRFLCGLYGSAAMILGLSAPDLSSALRRRIGAPLRARRC